MFTHTLTPFNIFAAFIIITAILTFLTIYLEKKKNLKIKRFPYIGLAVPIAGVGYTIKYFLKDGSYNSISLYLLIALIPITYAGLVVGIRRLNDIGLSPYFILLGFVPWINIMLGIVMLLDPGKQKNKDATEETPPDQKIKDDWVADLRK